MCDPVLDFFFFFFCSLALFEPTRGLSGPERAVMTFQHVVDYCDASWLLIFLLFFF